MPLRYPAHSLSLHTSGSNSFSSCWSISLDPRISNTFRVLLVRLLGFEASRSADIAVILWVPDWAVSKHFSLLYYNTPVPFTALLCIEDLNVGPCAPQKCLSGLNAFATGNISKPRNEVAA